jgi:zinc D-Ala-D-Ala carboxypeptidase
MPSTRLYRFADEFGITDLIARRSFIEYEEADHLIVAHVDADGREHLLVPDAAEAWHRMHASAARSCVSLLIISAFRSVARQEEIVRRKLSAGQSIEQVLMATAPSGCSEHHTGRALDIGTEGGAVLEPEFEQTAAFAWLQQNASTFGFCLSYPRENSQGYVYEPWHWRYQGDA